MPWSVRVRVDDGTGGWRELAGALVQPNVVLTCEFSVQSVDTMPVPCTKNQSHESRVIQRYSNPWECNIFVTPVSSATADGMRLLNATPYAGNDTGGVQTIAPSSIHVTWATGDGSRLRSDVSAKKGEGL